MTDLKYCDDCNFNIGMISCYECNKNICHKCAFHMEGKNHHVCKECFKGEIND